MILPLSSLPREYHTAIGIILPGYSASDECGRLELKLARGWDKAHVGSTGSAACEARKAGRIRILKAKNSIKLAFEHGKSLDSFLCCAC